MELVVVKLVMDGLLDAIRHGVQSADYVVNILGDGIVKLADDALVLDLPL